MRLPGERSREPFMAQAANLKDVSLPLLTPGVKLNTSLKTTGRSKIGDMGAASSKFIIC